MGTIGRARAAGILLLTMLVLAACDTAEERAEGHYQRALELLEAGEAERAMVEFRNVFRLDGNHHAARLAYAEQLVEMGETGEAIGQFRRLVEQDWSNVEGHKNLAELAFSADDWQTGVTHTEAAFELDPDDPEIRARKAMVDYYAGQRAEGRAMARAVLDQRPDLLPARMLLVWDLWEREPQAARQLIEEGFEHNPASWDLHSARLWSISQEGDSAAAGEQLHRMAELFPGNETVADSLIAWHLGEDDPDAAEAVLRERTEAVALGSPARIEADLRLVQFLLDIRGPDAARAELGRLAEAADDPQPYQRALAGLDAAEGEIELAIATLESIIAESEPSDSRRDSQIALAEILLATGQAEEGGTLVDAVLAEDSSHVGGLKLRADRLIAADRPDEAIRDLRAALNQEPRDPDILTLMAVAHERAGAHDLAGERLAAAVQVSDRAPAESIRYARFLLERGRVGPAETVIVDALRVHADDPDLLMALGQIHLQRQDWDRAGQVARRLREQGTQEAAALAASIEADALRGQERFDEALETIQGLAGEGGLAQSMAGIVQTYLLADNLAGARTYVEGVLARNPQDATARMMYAALLVIADETAEAEAAYREILADAPDLVPAWADLHGLLLDEGRDAEAAEVLAAGLEATGDDPNLMFLEAGRLEREGDFDGAIAIYEDLYALDTSSVVLANNLASLIATHRSDAADLDRAFAIARRLRGTEVPQFQDTYGWILSRRGDHEEALPYLERAAAALADDPLVQYHLGVTWYRLGRQSEARESLERAVDLAGSENGLPQMEEARRLLGTMEPAAEAAN